ncbi:hypothetical protein GCM10023339_76650 [Alloalcanivorax gelatiniphagus]
MIRQAHHWAALVLPASLMLQLFSTFIGGAFRRPRRATWLLLFATLVLTLVAGWSGYAMPDDSLSGTGLRIMHGLLLGIPLIGPPLTFLLFGGEFPGRIIETLYPLHVYVVPGLMALVIGWRVRLALAQGRSVARGSSDTTGRFNVIPARAQIARTAGLAFIAAGVLVLMAATMTVSPIWLYGPAESDTASGGSQPDWYLGFLDGALRLVPPGWEVTLWGGTWALGLLVPLAVVTTFIALVAAAPFVDGWVTKDSSDHESVERARDAPTRSGAGVAAVVFYGVLLIAGGVDVIGTHLDLAFETLIVILRVLLILGPIMAFTLTRAVCVGLREQDRAAELSGAETGIITRRADGGYIGGHGPSLAAGEPRAQIADVTAASR